MDNNIATVWEHVKTKVIYTITGECILEKTNEPAYLYQAKSFQPIWVKSKEEFLDGQFKKLHNHEENSQH